MAAVASQLLGTRTRVLVASANSSFRRKLLDDPSLAASHGEEAVGGAHALAKLVQCACDSVVLDRNLPDLDAGEVAEIIRKRHPQVEIEFVDSRAGDGEFERERYEGLPERKAEAREEVLELEQSAVWNADIQPVRGEEVEALPAMIGSSRAMQQVYRMARMVAPRDTTVLITGDTGTGKELVAEAIHKLSPRARHSFVVVNCAAIPEALLEAELFGHARGAFTGAVQSRLGRIHVAQGGTLFLDEVGELPLSMQAKLLRFLQNGEVQRLGSPDVYRVDVRVVCATNVRLTELVAARQFRQDLYYRLAIFPIAMPPLRERGEDVAALAEQFLKQLCAEVAVPQKRLAACALGHLRREPWPGNVRELHHAIERAFILAGNQDYLRVEHFQQFREWSELREV